MEWFPGAGRLLQQRGRPRTMNIHDACAVNQFLGAYKILRITFHDVTVGLVTKLRRGQAATLSVGRYIETKWTRLGRNSHIHNGQPGMTALSARLFRASRNGRNPPACLHSPTPARNSKAFRAINNNTNRLGKRGKAVSMREKWDFEQAKMWTRESEVDGEGNRGNIAMQWTQVIYGNLNVWKKK